MKRSKSHGSLQLDKLELLIVEGIIANPKSQVNDIQQAISKVGGSTIQKRLAALLDAGVIRRQISVIDWKAAGYKVHWRIMLSVRGRKPEDLAAYIMESLSPQYKDRVFIEELAATFDGDLRLGVRGRDDDDVYDFVKTGLAYVDGVVQIKEEKIMWSLRP